MSEHLKKMIFLEKVDETPTSESTMETIFLTPVIPDTEEKNDLFGNESSSSNDSVSENSTPKD